MLTVRLPCGAWERDCSGFPPRMAPTWHLDAIIEDGAIRKRRKIKGMWKCRMPDACDLKSLGPQGPCRPSTWQGRLAQALSDPSTRPRGVEGFESCLRHVLHQLGRFA